ncbi:MAG: hypothetical protein QG671_4455 [Actinomycetota bacterium]|nr:hypothetical protein [Actinomycetota bacterium]
MRVGAIAALAVDHCSDRIAGLLDVHMTRKDLQEGTGHHPGGYPWEPGPQTAAAGFRPVTAYRPGCESLDFTVTAIR